MQRNGGGKKVPYGSLLWLSALPRFRGCFPRRRGDGREGSAGRMAVGVGEKEMMVAKKERDNVFGKRKGALLKRIQRMHGWSQ